MTNGTLRCKTCKDKPLLYDVVVLVHLLGGHQVEIVNNEQALEARPLSVAVSNIKINNRQRKDYGDVQSLAASIKKFGLIQPIVLVRSQDADPNTGDDGLEVRLVAGGRRLAACRYLGITELVHARDFIWREELHDGGRELQLQAVELEENLRRKELHWSEHIAAKQRLFELMQSIHGVAKGFGAGKSGAFDGFSLRKLASMLGENPSVTSRDLELAGFVKSHPSLAALPTKADAVRKLGVAITVAAMQKIASKTSVVTPASGAVSSTVGAGALDAANITVTDASAPALTPITEERWVLYDGNFQGNIHRVCDRSVDLVLTDLPYNIGLGDSTAAHSAGLGGFDDSELDMSALCADVAVESWRTLRDNRFAVFFYGMNYHQELYDALTTVGFTVDVYPFIWLRDRSAPPDGFARYSKTYDPAFIASKGCPRFVRPNLANTIAIPSVRGAERLHAAQKPMALMQKFIEDMTTPDCVVLDMFAGAGTTGEAALRVKRKAILFELEPANCILIRARLGVL
jgi:DNA modification methylase